MTDEKTTSGRKIMAFTDEDLSEMKRIVAELPTAFNMPVDDVLKIGALLARLEAAEAYIKAKTEAPYKGAEAHKVWLKACGK